MFLKRVFILFLTFSCFPASGIVYAKMSFDPIQELKKSFPDITEETKDKEQSIEFCPDNTCDLFVAPKEVSIETLKDFAYLYIYLFSDYYILDEWRTRGESASIAKQILLKPQYQICKSDKKENSVRCILNNLSQKKGIKLFSVRYDENNRSLNQQNLNEAMKVNRLNK